MSRLGYLVSIVFLGLAGCMFLACGGSPGQIQSITLSPPSADAQNYPNGKVPFVATGHYNAAPTTVTPLQASWGVASEQLVNGVETFGFANGALSVDTNGVAQCTAGASGTYAVGAWVNLAVNGPPPGCPSGPFGQPYACLAVLGTAQLTCP